MTVACKIWTWRFCCVLVASFCFFKIRGLNSCSSRSNFGRGTVFRGLSPKNINLHSFWVPRVLLPGYSLHRNIKSAKYNCSPRCSEGPSTSNTAPWVFFSEITEASSRWTYLLNKIHGKTALLQKFSLGFLSWQSFDTNVPLLSYLVPVPSLLVSKESLLRSYRFKIIEWKRRLPWSSKYTNSGKGFSTLSLW